MRLSLHLLSLSGTIAGVLELAGSESSIDFASGRAVVSAHCRDSVNASISFVRPTIFQSSLVGSTNFTVEFKYVASTCVGVSGGSPCVSHDEGIPPLFWCKFTGVNGPFLGGPYRAHTALIQAHSQTLAIASRLDCPAPPLDKLMSITSNTGDGSPGFANLTVLYAAVSGPKSVDILLSGPGTNTIEFELPAPPPPWPPSPPPAPPPPAKFKYWRLDYEIEKVDSGGQTYYWRGTELGFRSPGESLSTHLYNNGVRVTGSNSDSTNQQYLINGQTSSEQGKGMKYPFSEDKKDGYLEYTYPTAVKVDRVVFGTNVDGPSGWVTGKAIVSSRAAIGSDWQRYGHVTFPGPLCTGGHAACTTSVSYTSDCAGDNIKPGECTKWGGSKDGSWNNKQVLLGFVIQAD